MSSISVPFRFNEFGQVETSVNESKFWKDQILLTLMTRFGERVMRPEFGSNIGNIVFESVSVAAESAVSTISVTFNTLLPKLRLIDSQVEVVDDSDTLEITIIYEVPSGNRETITVNTAIFNRFGDVLEEVPSGR